MLTERMSWGLLGFTLLLVLAAAGMVHFYPGYLTNTQYLSAIILLEILAAVVWNYRQRFVPALIVVFLGAGFYTPAQSAFSAIRWIVLAVGALVGIVLYLHEREHWFGVFHGIALSCVLSAFASAAISDYPQEACLKAASLLLLFAYAMTGARLAAFRHMTKFVAGLQIALEILTYVTGVAYFVFHYPLLGNPNSLGAVMGVCVLPLLVWAELANGVRGRRRRLFALLLALALLLSSYSRASIGASFVTISVLCVALRQYRFLFRGIALTLVAAVIVATFVPLKSNDSIENQPPVKKFLYKGHPTQDVLASRRNVWDETWDSIRVHPLFGTGFGTSKTSGSAETTRWNGLSVSSNAGVREHGNSYLAILEWQGLLGVVPFVALILCLGSYLGRVWSWVWRGGDGSSPSIALACTMTAGLFHSAFEDWLFAVGYYVCVFFWIMAFIFVDVLPPRGVTEVEYGRVFLAGELPNSEAIASGR